MGKLNKPRGRVGAGFTRTESTKTVDGRKLLGYVSYHTLSRAQGCHERSRWRPSPGSLAQPTTLLPRDRRPIVISDLPPASRWQSLATTGTLSDTGVAGAAAGVTHITMRASLEVRPVSCPRP